MPTSDVIVVLTTLPAGADAGALARALVDQRLAACVSVSAEMRSTYRWEGRVVEEAERLVVIKTSAGRLSELETAVERLHPYSVPEFVVLAADGGSAAYLGWVGQAVER